MRTLKASFLLIGPWEDRLQEIGAHIATDLQTAWHWIQDSSYDVVAISVTLVLGRRFSEFYEEIQKRSPGTQWILVVPEDFSPQQMARLHQDYRFCRVLKNYQDTDLEFHLFSALEEANQRKQDEHLALLLREQTQQLKRLQKELEERVHKRTRFLTEARRKLFFTNYRIEGFKKALMAVYEASSVPEIETLLNEVLSSAAQTLWIRIFYSPQDDIFERQLNKQLNFSQHRVPLYKEHEKIGSIFFLRAPEHHFTREEGDFFGRVADAVSLSIDRIQKLKQTESMKEQWESTFNSMSDPVVLIDENYDIIQSNKVLQDKLNTLGQDTGNRKCYSILFNRDKPCENCQRGKNFRTETLGATRLSFEVFSQSLVLDPEKPPVYVNLYHDMTHQLEMEKQILESAKMAELGTISSSIAHELNNPLGGILSFAQLIKMDLAPTHPLYADILEIENGVQRCKEIVQNLLGFARNPNVDKIGSASLQEVCSRALKIVELQTKSLGIESRLICQRDIQVQGHLNLLAQGLQNLLQVAIDRITEKNKTTKGLRGQLTVEILSTDQEPAQIIIKDNGLLDKNTNLPIGLGISVATQIFKDHEAKLDFSADVEHGNMAKISFHRPVLRS